MYIFSPWMAICACFGILYRCDGVVVVVGGSRCMVKVMCEIYLVTEAEYHLRHSLLIKADSHDQRFSFFFLYHDC